MRRSDNAPNDQMQKLMAELERLDKASDTIPADQLAANIEQRVNTLQSLAEASPEKDRDQWFRQMADVIGMAIQAGNFPAGALRIEWTQVYVLQVPFDVFERRGPEGFAGASEPEIDRFQNP